MGGIEGAGQVQKERERGKEKQGRREEGNSTHAYMHFLLVPTHR